MSYEKLFENNISTASSDAWKKSGKKAKKLTKILENAGIDDVKIALNGTKPIRFFGTGGGSFPTPAELVQTALRALEGE